MGTYLVSRGKSTLRVKVLFKRDLLSKMRMRLESGRERDSETTDTLLSL